MYLESESSLIGKLRLPEILVDSMRWAPMIEVRMCDSWVGLGWDGMGKDGVSWDGLGWDGLGWVG